MHHNIAIKLDRRLLQPSHRLLHGCVQMHKNCRVMQAPARVAFTLSPNNYRINHFLLTSFLYIMSKAVYVFVFLSFYTNKTTLLQVNIALTVKSIRIYCRLMNIIFLHERWPFSNYIIAYFCEHKDIAF